jgi:SAM-dependent methyltransferase
MDTCRACKRHRMLMYLPMGSHPPANHFPTAEQLKNEKEPSFNLDTCVCLDCALIQVADQIPADFFREYVYVPSASATMHVHFAEMAKTLKERFLSDPKSLIVDIGSNDGLFLKACKDLGARVLGIEPARNLTEVARAKGIEVVNEYFNPERAEAVRAKYGPAMVITTTNTFNHIDDLHGFVKGVRTLLDDKGAFVIEVPHALDLVVKNEFDTMYHEHLSTFSVKSLAELLKFFEMEVFDIQPLPIHGGSMRIFCQKKERGGKVMPIVGEYLKREADAKLFDEQTYRDHAKRVEANKKSMMELLRKLKSQGKRLAGYGAPAKGNSLLNYYGIGPDLLDYLVDRNPLKQNKFSPGMHIPVYPAEKLMQDKPDYVLILAWNFADEILQQQAEFRRAGGKFILPIPETRVLD